MLYGEMFGLERFINRLSLEPYYGVQGNCAHFEIPKGFKVTVHILGSQKALR